MIDEIASVLAESDDIIYGLLTPEEAAYYQRMARAVIPVVALLFAEWLDTQELSICTFTKMTMTFWPCDGNKDVAHLFSTRAEQ
jgi:hypothetical protein